MPIFRLRGLILRWSFVLNSTIQICNDGFLGVIIWEENHDEKLNFEQLPGWHKECQPSPFIRLDIWLNRWLNLKL